jgi:hypothetical protein
MQSADDAVYASSTERAGTASFSLLPDAVGSSSGTITVTGRPPAHTKQLVFPDRGQMRAELRCGAVRTRGGRVARSP